MNFANTGYLNWVETTVSNIAVSSESGSDGEVTIGLELSGSAGQWGSVDDFTLVRVGDLDAEPAQITEIRPVTIDTLIREAPLLPATVTAVYSDGTTASLAVAWSDYEPAQLASAGSFQLSGTVTGTELQAEATIRVNYRPFDVNGDGNVDIGDAAIVSYYAGAGAADSGSEAQDSDLNNNGTVDAEDIRLIVDRLLQP